MGFCVCFVFLFNIPNKHQGEFSPRSPGQESASLWQNTGSTQLQMLPGASGGPLPGGTQGSPMASHLTETFPSEKASHREPACRLEEARRAGGRVKMGGQGFSSLGDKHSLCICLSEQRFIYLLISPLICGLQIPCWKAAGNFL